ncbi:uncharacterized protein y4hQ [Tribolium castaneum]|uniref:Uncharacterized protein y4hQ-like Protein n=1 Tax=Tribolium castaneum TaxID=7070 RepID=D6W6F5_TRICA|nr:PREDICTED: uncharacterized protein y4hQ [Tribolium castaneum]EFA11354.1 Uncharacterized protein y4hQ-like Protein [Tribolium castaneum]|eukprot:XP_008200293.1 PREDICTED: uncharacterized protein y4hQ [Tribolium castaneum]
MATSSTGQGEGTANEILQLKVSLVGIKPPIWRRIHVRKSDTFRQLHDYIQQFMGWGNYHLHVFVAAGDVRIGIPEDSVGFDDIVDEGKAKISSFLKNPKDKVKYTYDYGDNWQHVITVEKLLPSVPNVHYPVCVGGRRACPPEDCGGVWGYVELLHIRANPSHPEYNERITEWLDDLYPDFDPEKFEPTDCMPFF